MKLSVHIALLGFLLESGPSLVQGAPGAGFGFHFNKYRPATLKLGETALNSNSRGSASEGVQFGLNVCRTHATPRERATAEHKYRGKHHRVKEEDGQRIVFPVNFHVVAENKTWEGGWVRHHQIRSQVENLNKNFKHANIHFELRKVTHTIDEYYFREGGIDESSDAEFKSNLRQGGADTLNVYTSGFLQEDEEATLGRATYPWQYQAPDLGPDGISIKWTTLPGNDREQEGKMLTHEAGHWLGLYHTFEGQSCEGEGDGVDDTPQQAEYAWQCGVVDNSCPNASGVKAGTNFMDYKPDSCLYEFTPGQIKKMRAYAREFRVGR
ncbi:hypothetical protein FA15DRAFT_670384 [Coprinopsis marcescibilis]|uniref:Peptidase M43 pregnancy-associated plasma-A domain-containing protein n=1 Tax=Coprinopsis marcescibilis TaxID=230819 RepID=A0A5C3KUP8_COPMA|nr:hypothetical protein FA15DRAFT_670384 [Coprinopsis marcescibilis]